MKGTHKMFLKMSSKAAQRLKTISCPYLSPAELSDSGQWPKWHHNTIAPLFPIRSLHVHRKPVIGSETAAVTCPQHHYPLTTKSNW